MNQQTRIPKDLNNQTNLSFSVKSKIDKKKCKKSPNLDKMYGIALNDNKNTKIYKNTGRERHKRFHELKEKYPLLEYITWKLTKT